jgi:hypothetical protein
MDHTTEKERRAAYRAANKATISAYMAKWSADNPEKRRANQRKYSIAHPEKVAADKKAWSAANPPSKQQRRDERIRNKDTHAIARRRRHEAFLRERELLAGRPRPKQCEACGDDGTAHHGIVWDHCHKAGQFRGWLCVSCNSALGMVRDDRNRLLKLIAYLDRTKDWICPQLVLSGF